MTTYNCNFRRANISKTMEGLSMPVLRFRVCALLFPITLLESAIRQNPSNLKVSPPVLEEIQIRSEAE